MTDLQAAVCSQTILDVSAASRHKLGFPAIGRTIDGAVCLNWTTYYVNDGIDCVLEVHVDDNGMIRYFLGVRGVGIYESDNEKVSELPKAILETIEGYVE